MIESIPETLLVSAFLILSIIYVLSPILIVIQLNSIHKEIKRGREETRLLMNAQIQYPRGQPRPAPVVRRSSPQ